MVKQGDAAGLPAEPTQADFTAEGLRGRSADVGGAWAAYPPMIGRYLIEGVIGTGGFGTVYRGVHRWLRVPAAIKVIQCEQSDQTRADFRREAQRQARLQAHPGIAQVRDFGLFADPRVGTRLPYYVMDLIPGNQNLTGYAVRQQLSMNDRLRLFAQVCDAVQYAHDRGILHLDLKPGNILVYPEMDGRPAQTKVIDFGIARAADPAMERSQRLGVSGTVAYMSPEQTEPSIPLDVRSDVYSLGVVLYELLTGWLPYEVGGRPASEAYRVVRETPPDFESPRVAKLPSAVRAILTRTLGKRVQDRYESVAGLAADVREYLRGGVPRASGAGAGGRLWAVLRGGIAGWPIVTALLIMAATMLVTDRIGVPLINRWTRANVAFERNVLRSPVSEYQKTVLVGWKGPTPGPARDGEPGIPSSQYRGLLADLLTRLSQGVKPIAVVIDHTFKPSPAEDTTEADARFAAAAAALVKAGVPVIVSVTEPALASRGAQPPDSALRTVIADAVGGWGHVKTSCNENELCEVPLLEWDQHNPDPGESLAMVAVMSILEGASRPGYQLDEATGLLTATAFAEPSKTGGRARVPTGSPRVFQVSSVQPDDDDPSRTDAMFIVPMPPIPVREAATLDFNRVLSESEMRSRCDKKVVVVGLINGLRDVHPVLAERVPGVYIHATAIEMLLTGPLAAARMPSAIEEKVILGAGALLGLLLPVPFLRRRAWWPHWAVLGLSIGWAGVIAAVVIAGVVAARNFNYLLNPLVVLFAMALAAALCVGAGLIRRSHPLHREALP